MSDLSEAQWAEIDAEFERKIATRDAEIERLRAALKLIEIEDHDEEANPGPYSEIASKALASH